MHPNTRVATEALLAQAGWIRQLARTLVGDGPRADDLAQDTWVRALERPPRADLPLRGWIATVMRNLLRQDRRGGGHRREREARAARAAAHATDEDGLAVLERVSMQRELVGAVLELEEPYRTAVLLRYFEELTPAAIADRQGMPVSTVKTRLARGLERLRARLDSRHGADGKGWMLALVPVLRRPAGLTPVTPFSSLALGALIVNTKLVLLALVLGTFGAGYYLLSREPEPAIASGTTPGTALLPPTERPDPARDRPRTPGTVTPPESRARSALNAPTPTREPEARGAVDAGVTVRGRVVDAQGRPVPGLEVAGAAGGDPLGVSASDGTFDAHVRQRAALTVRDEDYTTVMQALALDEARGKEVVIVVAPRIEASGSVVDGFGAPLGGALVELALPVDFRAELGWVLDYSTEVRFASSSGQDGRFLLADAPAIPGARLTARLREYQGVETQAPVGSRSDLVLVLESPHVEARLLRGVVEDPNGAPVPGARVSLGIDTRVTGADGSFTFELDDPESDNRLVSEFITPDETKLLALKPGYLPGELSARRTDGEGRPVWPEHVVLRLGAEPLTITGHVVDQEGVALQGIRVWIDDPTFFGGIRTDERRFPDLTHMETELAGLDSGWPVVETDANGEFRYPGLLERDYRLVALDPATLLRTTRAGVAAGARNVELVLSRAESYETIRGLVVDGRGRPVEGASVSTTCDAFRMVVAGRLAGTRHSSAARTTTDARGRFEFEWVPKDRVYFRIDHPDAIPVEFGRAEETLRELVGEDPEDFTITVPLRCHFRIELADVTEADALEIHDADGEVLQLSEFQGSSRREYSRAPLVEGKSPALAVGDTAAALVLFLEGLEVRRVPLSLTPGEQPTLRL